MNTVEQAQPVSPDETTDHEVLLEATSTPTLSPDATNVSSSVEPDATQDGQSALPDVPDKHILLPDVTIEQSSDVPDATHKLATATADSNLLVEPTNPPETLSDAMLSGRNRKELGDNLQNPESVVSVSETPEETSDNITMNEDGQSAKQSNEQISDNLETAESLDPETVTNNSEMSITKTF